LGRQRSRSSTKTTKVTFSSSNSSSRAFLNAWISFGSETGSAGFIRSLSFPFLSLSFPSSSLSSTLSRPKPKMSPALMMALPIEPTGTPV
jgi:hypothetical protein